LPAIRTNIFPNSGTLTVTIRLEEDLPSMVQLFNLMGELMQQSSLSKNELTLDLSRLQPAAYLVRISNSRGVYSQKMVRN
jgi:hypothetical protein